MNEQVEQMKDINFTGNIIPPIWYQKIKTEKGRTDLVAIQILADLIYWYRPTLIRDPETGKVTGYKQKFKGDKLQRSYTYYAKFLNVSKDIIKKSIRNLERLGLINKEFRTVEIAVSPQDTRKINNVLYIEPIIKNVGSLSKLDTLPIGKNNIDPVGGNTPQVGGKNTQTNTKIYKENYKEICKDSIHVPSPAVVEGEIVDVDQQASEHVYSHLPEQIDKKIDKKAVNIQIIEIFNFWNSQRIIQHRKMTDKIKRSIKSALKDYTAEEIRGAIANYAVILHDDKYYWDYTWSLTDFLKRGLIKFALPFDVLEKNYTKRQGKEENAKKVIRDLWQEGGRYEAGNVQRRAYALGKFPDNK